jgi:mitochondrial fission protein ELM1
MRILVLADRRTGHVRQCLGLVRVIGRERPVAMEELAIRPQKLASDFIRRLIAAMPRVSPGWLLRRCYGLGISDVAGFDMVIGSGRPTILAGLLISRLTGARFVYCGRASGYDAREFGLVLVPYRGEETFPNHAHGPIPSPVDPARYPPPRSLSSAAALAGATVTLLVGGPSSRRGWSSLDWGRLAYFIVAAEHQLGVRWSIATSPRTPAFARGLLEAAFSALETGGAFVDFQTAGPGSADRLLGSDAICVTSDSTSMIAEGLAAMRPVVGISTRKLKASRDDRLLADLASDGSFADLPLSTLTPDQFASILTQLHPPRIDPRDRLHAALADLLQGIG